MKRLVLLLLLCSSTSPVKHSLNFYFMLISGIPNVPDYIGMVSIEGVMMFYFDSTLNTGELRQEWVKEMLEDDSEYWDLQTEATIHYQQILTHRTDGFKQPSNQTQGVHVIQEIRISEWDDETDAIEAHNRFSYDGEEFLTFDLETETWIASHPLAADIKQQWDNDKDYNSLIKQCLIKIHPDWMRTFLHYGNSSLNRKDLPSVSLLQKTSSSPVSCHATGFYPNRALIFWRKDGEEIHEGVDHGDILPNHDGSFQINVVLEISSLALEDWRRYDCVFQLSDTQQNIITRLDKDLIQTNSKESDEGLSEVSIATIATVAVAIVIIVTALGLTAACKKKNERPSRSSLDTSSIETIERSSTPSSDISLRELEIRNLNNQGTNA